MRAQDAPTLPEGVKERNARGCLRLGAKIMGD